MEKGPLPQRAPTPGTPDHAPPRQNNQGRVGGPKILAPLSCALTIGALWDTSKYKKVSCSEPLGVTILLLSRATDHVRGSHMDQCSRRVLWSAGSLPCCARGALAYTRVLSKPSPAPRRRNFEWRVFTPPKKIRLSSDCSGRRRKVGLGRDRARPGQPEGRR